MNDDIIVVASLIDKDVLYIFRECRTEVTVKINNNRIVESSYLLRIPEYNFISDSFKKRRI